MATCQELGEQVQELAGGLDAVEQEPPAVAAQAAAAAAGACPGAVHGAPYLGVGSVQRFGMPDTGCHIR